MKMKYLQRYFNINATFGIKSENQEDFFLHAAHGILFAAWAIKFVLYLTAAAFYGHMVDWTFTFWTF